MKKPTFYTFICAAAILLFSTPNLAAQDTVFCGDFETASITPMWTLTGSNSHTTVATFQTVAGVSSLCMKRMPGKPNDNGGIEQQVHLMGDVYYLFHADIAVVENG